mgnify:CR=1 FL=1
MATKKYISPDNLLYYHQRLKALFAAKGTTIAQYGITDAYTKTEVDTAINNALAGITGISFEVVQTLPQTGEQGTIYLVDNSGTGQNSYDEYIYANGAFERLGTTDIDLSGYVLATDLVEATTTEIDTILAS